MMRLRLLVLSFALLAFAMAQAKPAAAICLGTCPNDAWCRACYGQWSFCVAGSCAI